MMVRTRSRAVNAMNALPAIAESPEDSDDAPILPPQERPFVIQIKTEGDMPSFNDNGPPKKRGLGKGSGGRGQITIPRALPGEGALETFKGFYEPDVPQLRRSSASDTLGGFGGTRC